MNLGAAARLAPPDPQAHAQGYSVPDCSGTECLPALKSAMIAGSSR